jgi:cell division protein FtsQ
MPVRAPADKRFRRAHLKPGRKRRWSVWKWRLLGVAIAVGLAGYSAHRAVSAFLALRILQVQTIDVQGNHRLSNGEILALLEGLRGQSILAADLEASRRGLLNSPWVAEASLRRRLPSTVDVIVLERTPLGVGRINGELYLVDDRGTVIDIYGPQYADLDLPIIDGLSSSPGDEIPDASRALLARRLLDALRERNLADRISQIDVSDARNAIVLVDDDPASLRLGNERFVERLQAYFDLEPALRERVPDIDYVDLRFDRRVYVKAEGASRPQAAPPWESPPKRAKRRGA